MTRLRLASCHLRYGVVLAIIEILRSRRSGIVHFDPQWYSVADAYIQAHSEGFSVSDGPDVDDEVLHVPLEAPGSEYVGAQSFNDDSSDEDESIDTSTTEPSSATAESDSESAASRDV